MNEGKAGLKKIKIYKFLYILQKSSGRKPWQYTNLGTKRFCKANKNQMINILKKIFKKSKLQ